MKVSNKKGIAETLIGLVLGFSFFWLTSHPEKSPVRRKIPAKRYKNLHYLPEIKIEHKDRHYHLHHWAIFGISYLPLLLLRKRAKLNILHGFFIGSILQGLTYHDRFKFIKPLEEIR